MPVFHYRREQNRCQPKEFMGSQRMEARIQSDFYSLGVQENKWSLLMLRNLGKLFQKFFSSLERRAERNCLSRLFKFSCQKLLRIIPTGDKVSFPYVYIDFVCTYFYTVWVAILQKVAIVKSGVS